VYKLRETEMLLRIWQYIVFIEQGLCLYNRRESYHDFKQGYDRSIENARCQTHGWNSQQSGQPARRISSFPAPGVFASKLD
jgi:hypothetical protein